MREHPRGVANLKRQVDMAQSRTAAREYKRQWLARRRAAYFDGKSCVDCGATEQLELDHVDPATKVSHRIWSWRTERREAELAKCVVRCRPCHQQKTLTERNARLKPCGTDAAYHRGCKCLDCRAAHRSACLLELADYKPARPERLPYVPKPSPPKTNAARWLEQGMRRLARKS